MPIIAIDGPVCSGKSTLAEALAKRLGLWHLDSGSLYRSIAYVSKDGSLDLARVTIGDKGACIDGNPVTPDMIRNAQIDALTPEIAKHPDVREYVSSLINCAALNFARSAKKGLVAEGRDMTSVVFSETALLMIYLTATAVKRANRLLLNQKRGDSYDSFVAAYAAVLYRDHLDTNRKEAPLICVPDAIVIDSTELSQDEVLETIVLLWQHKLKEL